MIYSNDDTDREVRKRDYWLTVYLLPVVIVSALSCVIYFSYLHHFISMVDRNFSYIISIGLAIFLYARNKMKWLKIPGGSFYRVPDIDKKLYSTSVEPLEYDRMYYNSKKQMILAIVLGLVFTGIGIWLFTGYISYVFSTANIIMGLSIFIYGLRGLLDKSPKLKLSAKGIWTNKLGFVNWNNINDVKVVVENNGRSPGTFLEIYLIDTIYEEANQPDERMRLDEIDDFNFIAIDIDNFKSKSDTEATF